MNNLSFNAATPARPHPSFAREFTSMSKTMTKGKRKDTNTATMKVEVANGTCGEPARTRFGAQDKLNYCRKGMVHTMNNLIFNLFSPPARTRLSDAILPARPKLRPDQDSTDMLFGRAKSQES